MSKKNYSVDVYTDGSCLKVNKITRAGYGVHFPNEELPDISRPFLHKPITNQRAELYAIYKALKKITENLNYTKINVYSDSQYSIKSLTIWIKNWKKNNWKTANGGDVLNQDIIKLIDNILQKNKCIKFTHVRSHTGKTDPQSIGNERADKLATTGAVKDT